MYSHGSKVTSMASKRKSLQVQRKLKQSSLLDGLARYERPGKSSSNLPSIVELEDSDPYKFVNSQSMEPGDSSSKTPSLTACETPQVPVSGGQSSLKPSTPALTKSKKGPTASSSSLMASSTPVQQPAAAKGKKAKNKKSPAVLTEDERLKLQEEEDLKRAIEASRQDMQRKDRKRKRDKMIWEQAQLQSMQKKVKTTLEMVDSAKNLDEKTLKDSVPVTMDTAEAVPSTENPISSALTAAVMCEDPPSLTPLTAPHSPPLTPTRDDQLDLITGTHPGSSGDATPPIVVPSERVVGSGKPTQPLSQLSSVSVKKLSVRKSSTANRPVAKSSNLNITSSDKNRLGGVKASAEETAKLSQVKVSVTPVSIRKAKRVVRERDASGPAPVESVQHPGDSPTTPLLIREGSVEEGERQHSLPPSSKSPPPSRTAATSITPSLTSDPCRAGGDTAGVPDSVCIGTKDNKEVTRQVRRNLSLSYSKKQGQRQQFRLSRSREPDESVQLLSVDRVAGGKDRITGGASLAADMSTPPISTAATTSRSDSEAVPPASEATTKEMADIDRHTTPVLRGPINSSSVTTTDLTPVMSQGNIGDGLDKDTRATEVDLRDQTPPPSDINTNLPHSDDNVNLVDEDTPSSPHSSSDATSLGDEEVTVIAHAGVGGKGSPRDEDSPHFDTSKVSESVMVHTEEGLSHFSEIANVPHPVGKEIPSLDHPRSSSHSLHQPRSEEASRPLFNSTDPVVSSCASKRVFTSPSLKTSSTLPPKRIKLSDAFLTLDAKTRSVFLKLKQIKQNEESKPRRANPPPDTYADSGTSPADYTKIILGSFNSYFSQLARAQASVLQRVRWGKLQPTGSRPSRKLKSSQHRSAQTWGDKYLTLSLKLVSKSRESSGPRAGVLFEPGFKFSLSEDESCEEGEETGADIAERGDLSAVAELERQSESSAGYLTAGEQPAVGGEEGEGGGGGVEEREKGGIMEVEEEGMEEEGEEEEVEEEGMMEGEGELEERGGGMLVTDEDLSHFRGGSSEPILIGTQCEAGSAGLTEGAMTGLSFINNQSERSRSHTPSPSPRDITTSHTRLPDSPLSPQQQRSSPWLNSRKPPPAPPKKTRARRTPQASLTRPKLGSVAKPGSATKGKRGGGGGRSSGGSAAARLILSRKTVSSDEGSDSDVALDSVSERGRGERQRVGSELEQSQSRRGESQRVGSQTERLRRGKQGVGSSSSDSSALDDHPRQSQQRRRQAVESSTSSAESDQDSLSHSRTTSPQLAVIDLTEDPSSKASSSTSIPRHPCPICRKTFSETEIEAHVNECLKNPVSEERSDTRCGSCGREFERSLLHIHEETCEGGSNSSDDNFMPAKRRRGAAERSGAGRERRKGDYQTTLSDFSRPSRPSSESEDIDDDTVELTSHRASATPTRRSRSNTFLDDPDDPDDPDHTDILAQPHVTRCEDGGYMVDPTSISSSPIRSFTRLEDLDPQERVRFQNQFQNRKASGRGKKPLSFRQQTGRGWTGRDSFDELRDGTRSVRKTASGRGRGRGKFYNKKTYFKNKRK